MRRNASLILHLVQAIVSKGAAHGYRLVDIATILILLLDKEILKFLLLFRIRTVLRYHSTFPTARASWAILKAVLAAHTWHYVIAVSISHIKGVSQYY